MGLPLASPGKEVDLMMKQNSKLSWGVASEAENEDEVVLETPEQPRQSEMMEDGQLRPQNIERGGQKQMLLETNHNSTQEITMYNAGKRALMISGPKHSNNPNLQPAMTSNSTGKKTLLQPKTPCYSFSRSFMNPMAPGTLNQ